MTAVTNISSLFYIVVALGLLVGFSFGFWGCVSLVRLFAHSVWCPGWIVGQRSGAAEWDGKFTADASGEGHRILPGDVAVVVPARNEAEALPRCIEALKHLVPTRQIFVASDGSSDGTVRLADALGCTVSDIQPNGGKARALQYVIETRELCKNFKAVLICDADSQIDPDYFKNTLPLFDDPTVAAVACHQLSTWRPDWFPSLSPAARGRWGTEVLRGLRKLLYTAYRVRLFRMMQGVYQYGQSWRPLNVSYIAPGAGSMYRTAALEHIDVAAPGLVIEDFNMTFEVHHKRLGRIAYVPTGRLASEDPFTFEDYCKQIRRWYLGFWQTVWRHGLWPSKFCLALALFSIEVLAFSCFLTLLPMMVIAHATLGLDTYAVSVAQLGMVEISPYTMLLAYLGLDFTLTVAVAIYERRPELLLFAPAFPVIRYVDAIVYLRSFFGSFRSTSDGTWRSPTRQMAGVV